MNKQTSSNVTKHYKTGLELEMFTLSPNGQMVNEGLPLIKQVSEKYPEMDIQKEAGKNMVEFATDAEVGITDIARQIVDSLEKIIVCAQENDLVLYPFGTYPGSFTPALVEEKRYSLLQKIFGKKRYIIGGRCCGFHCHFTLPKGVFDSQKKNIKDLISSKHKDSMVNVFNLFIAMDPALTCFAQSSPYYQGKHLGKDSRIVIYRGGKLFGSLTGDAAFFDAEYGGLPAYSHTGTNLRHTIENHFSFFKKIIDEYKLNPKLFLKHKSILSATWAPVRINASGTTEQRGMDSNLPSVIIAIALLIQFICKEVQEKFVEIVASDEAIQNPFTYKDGKILVPPDSHVRSQLQLNSAIEGLDNDEIFRYCQALFKLGKDLTPENYQPLLEPLGDMLKDKKTLSDRIMDKAKELGSEKGKDLTNEMAAELATHFSHELYKDLVDTKHKVEELKK